MIPVQAVSIVSAGGTPMQLTNQRGAPYPTTGFGALVFNTGAHLIDPLIDGSLTLDGAFTVNGDLTVDGDINFTGDLIGPGGPIIGTGTVTSIAAGTGLSTSPGSPITTTGTISLANTAVTPGTYGSSTQSAVIAIDQQGRITAASNATIAGGGGGTGTVTTVSVASANGLAGTVANPTTTPAITLSTSITGMLLGNGTAISAATAGTDYMTPANVSAAYQPLDADLTALAALSTTGMMARSAANTYTMRTITGTTSRLTVTNGDGIAGNPTLDISATYDGLWQPKDTGLTVLSSIGTGIVANTAADAFSPRTITGTASRVTITNGDGVAGNPTINISATYDALFQPVDATLTSLAAYNTNGLLTQTAADTFTGRTITGTASRLAVTNGSGVSGNPTLDIDSAYVGQSTITTLGTVATGTWQGSIIAGQYGGTGVNNTGKTITLGGNLTTSGAFASTFTMTGTTGVTFPTTGTLATLTDLTAYAPLASPTFTGDPKAPTPTAGDNDTSVATTAFVTTAITAVNGSLGQVQAGAGSCTLALNTDIVIGAYTVVSGNSGSWLNATTGVYTPPAGKYFIQSVNSVGHPPAGNGTWSLAARKNGTVITGTRQSMSGSATFVTTITVGCYVDANGTDTFDFVAQANASSMTEQGGDFTAFSIAGTTGVYLPLAGGTLTGGLTGTTATFSGAVSTNGFTAGYLEIPQNAQTGNYTGVLGDSGKHLYHAVAAAAATYTIPANGSVAYPIGATLTFVNDSANAVTIAITTDTLVLSPGTTTGSRTLATGGVATAVKVTSTRWIINGTGLT